MDRQRASRRSSPPTSAMYFTQAYRTFPSPRCTEGPTSTGGLKVKNSQDGGDKEVIKDPSATLPRTCLPTLKVGALQDHNQANFASHEEGAEGRDRAGRRAVSAKVFYDLGELMVQAPMRFGKVHPERQTAGARNSLIGLSEGVVRTWPQTQRQKVVAV